jgi:hypothetical protein
MANEIKDKAYFITLAVFTRAPTDTIEHHEDRLYRTVDAVVFLTEDQKAEFYARLAESLTKDMPFADAWNTVTAELERTLG